MSTPRFGAVIGLSLGAIWAVAEFEGAVLAGFLSAVGYVTVLVIQGRVDVRRLLRHDEDSRSSEPTVNDPTIKRTRTTLK